MPVLANSHHVATIVGYRACDRQLAPGEISQFMHQTGLASDAPQARRLRKAYQLVPVIPPGIQCSHLLLLQTLAQQLGEMIRRVLQANFNGAPVFLRRAKEFVEAHLAEPLTVGEVAAHACLCPQQFCKRFKQVTGLTFHQYLVGRRVERAKELLLNPQQKLLDVAFAAGFQSLATFHRVFKKHTGKPPSHYRPRA